MTLAPFGSSPSAAAVDLAGDTPALAPDDGAVIGEDAADGGEQDV